MSKQSIYISVLKWILFSLAFTPLIVVWSTLFPFIFGKTIFIRTAVTIFWVLFSILIFYLGKTTDIISQTKLKLISAAKNPLFIFTSFFVLLMFFSVIFAVNPYRAFFGDIERGEGYLGVLYFFGFFIASLLVFEKKDWLIFFKLSLFTGGILFFHGLYQYADFVRMQSLIGNPAFLAGYFLFIIFAGSIVLFSDQNRWWRLFGGLSGLMATIGVFLTQTRGAIVGLGAGLFALLVYFSIYGDSTSIMRLNLKKLAITLILIMVIFGGIFWFTKNAEIWQKIPGVNRFTAISFNDSTIQTRLIAAGVSLNAVNPSKNSWGRFLIGWGPENFNIAYNKYYNPNYLKYENLWFDRAHNKLFDVLVMDGILGFLAYLGIWLSVLYLIFRKHLPASILFFSVAYFVQNLFLFDQISTYIPFFAFLAFVIRIYTDEKQINTDNKSALYISVASLVAVFFVYFLITAAFIPFYQMNKFINAIKSGSAQRVFDDLNKFTKPYNYAQRELRNRFLQLTASYGNNQGLKPLVDKSILLFEEMVLREPSDPRYFTMLADTYRAQGELGNVEARKKSDEYFLKALELSPKRQDLLYNVAINVYGDKEGFKTMEEYLDRMLNYAPDVPMAKIYYATAITMAGPKKFNKGMDLIESALSNLGIALNEQQLNALRNIYNLYLNYFYEKKDPKGFLTAMEGAKKIELMIENINEERYKAGLIKELPPKKSEEFASGIEGFKKTGWLAIDKK